jgi:hypothetical protein
MIAAILYLLLIFAGVTAVVQFGELVRRQTVDVRCHCGARRTTLICVDPSDARRLGETLSEDCPTCRATDSQVRRSQRSTFRASNLRPAPEVHRALL